MNAGDRVQLRGTATVLGTITRVHPSDPRAYYVTWDDGLYDDYYDDEEELLPLHTLT